MLIKCFCMKRDKQTYIFDLIESCNQILTFINGLSLEDYNNNILVRRAVEREFEIIGEILKRFRDDFPELFCLIPDAAQIIGFRNVIAHGYDVVSDDLVYNIVKKNVPRFLEVIKNINPKS